MMRADRNWVNQAAAQLAEDASCCSETSLIRIETPLGYPTIYMKDESTHATGSLKHRLARSLFSYGLCNGWIDADTHIIECSSGSTAVSEAYFAKMLGLRFTAVMTKKTSAEKIALIEAHGGTCMLVDTEAEAKQTCVDLAREPGTHFMDQFTYAERAVDWQARSSMANVSFEQLAGEPNAIPDWIVVGAGTGGTATSFGRFIRARGHATQLCLADPEGSAYHYAINNPGGAERVPAGSLVEGIGRKQCEASFLPMLIDRAIAVADASSIGAAHALSHRLGKLVGGSSGTNLWVSILLAQEMHRQGHSGSILTLICDTGERYRSTMYDPAWLAAKDVDYLSAMEKVGAFIGRAEIVRRDAGCDDAQAMSLAKEAGASSVGLHA
ncbi:PLP-dependent cysteine synthase family protein [Devosia epidermidihirudinis]|uniref:PLP-dependent cysteine synthase family protein n=1 Tax=Devosia epidermidihirudinis TaxID=1293439 RepID=UPI0009E322C4|nr:PLP-dependent cysteine synthase family protein [Devosia epidermidihirudinis]